MYSIARAVVLHCQFLIVLNLPPTRSELLAKLKDLNPNKDGDQNEEW